MPLFRLRRFLLRASAIFAVVVATSLHAQNNWANDAHNATRENLWSIAFSGSSFVAVGENGTLLYSDYDGAGWHVRPSGTTAWLVGVGHGQGRWIVVGDTGTILVSDDDGETWRTRPAGTTARLNAVVHGNGRWLAVGEQGVVLTSTDRGDTWTVRTLPQVGFLRALAFGQNRFLFGGAAGALFATSEGAVFERIPISTTSDIEAAAISPGRMFLAGSRGLRASFTTAWFVEQNAELGTFRGIAARSDTDVSIAADRLAFHYAGNGWNVTQLHPGFLVTAMAVGRNEAVAVGFGGGIARSSSLYQVAVVSGGVQRADYGSDVRFRALSTGTATNLSFQWQRNGVDLPGATAAELVLRAVGPAANGDYSVRAYSGSAALRATATRLEVQAAGRPAYVDPGFRPPFAVPSLIRFQRDGKLLLYGVTEPGTLARAYRLHPSGALDETFRVASAVGTNSVVPLGDGRLYTATGTGAVRLLDDGALDATFRPDGSLRGTQAFAALADGRVYVWSEIGLVRLFADGTRDASFRPISDTAYRFLGVDTAGRLVVAKSERDPFVLWQYPGFGRRFLPDGTIDPGYYLPLTNAGALRLVGDDVFGTRHSYGRFGATTSFFRFDDTGSPASYISPPTTEYPDYNSLKYIYRPDGGLWDFRPSGGVWRLTAYGPRDGIDPTQRLELPDTATYTPLAVGPDAALYVKRDPQYSVSGAVAEASAFLRLRPTVGAASRLANLSVRASVTATSPLVVGFITGGTGQTRALLRAVGPGLAAYGVADPLPAPDLALAVDGVVRVSNQGWPAVLASRFAALGAFPLAQNSPDSALEADVAAGQHTAIITPSLGSAGGTALLELYESGAATAPRRLVNVSARGPVASGRPLIVGFNLSGAHARRVLIRGIGPALAVFGISDALTDPKLTLYRETTVLYENDDWSALNPSLTSSNAGLGAFPLPAASRDAAMVATLLPGSYTAVIEAARGPAAGTVLVEVYSLDP